MAVQGEQLLLAAIEPRVAESHHCQRDQHGEELPKEGRANQQNAHRTNASSVNFLDNLAFSQLFPDFNKFYFCPHFS